MKTVYIPKGETVCYESLETEHLIVKGCVKVTYAIHAKTISGNGVVIAQSVHADDIRVREVEAVSVICKRFVANQARTPELIASESTAVSTFLSATYVKTGRLIVTVSEVDEVDATEVVNLGAKKRSLLGLLFVSALRSFWAALTAPTGKQSPEKTETRKQEDHDQDGGGAGAGGSEESLREEIAKTVREILAEQSAQAGAADDETENSELKQMQSFFRLLRDQGYTLQIVPGVQETDAPVLDFGTTQPVPDAA